MKIKPNINKKNKRKILDKFFLFNLSYIFLYYKIKIILFFYKKIIIKLLNIILNIKKKKAH